MFKLYRTGMFHGIKGYSLSWEHRPWVVVQSVLHLEQAETTDLKHQESRRKFGLV